MIYINNSTDNVSLYIERHHDIDSSVKFVLTKQLTDSTIIESDQVDTHPNYYVYMLDDIDDLSVGRYIYKINDASTNEVYESGLLYVGDDTEPNEQNLNNDIVYEG